MAAPVTLQEFFNSVSSGADHWKLSRRYYFVCNFQLPNVSGETNLPLNDLWKNKLTFLVKSIKLPDFALRGLGGGPESFQVINTNGSFIGMEDATVLPNDNTFVVTFADTVDSVMENLFTPWMMSLKTQDLRTYSLIRNGSNLDVDFYDNSFDKLIMRYNFTRIFPVLVGSPESDQTALNLTYRPVTFKFDQMRITNVTTTASVNKKMIQNMRDILLGRSNLT